VFVVGAARDSTGTMAPKIFCSLFTWALLPCALGSTTVLPSACLHPALVGAPAIANGVQCLQMCSHSCGPLAAAVTRVFNGNIPGAIKGMCVNMENLFCLIFGPHAATCQPMMDTVKLVPDIAEILPSSPEEANTTCCSYLAGVTCGTTTTTGREEVAGSTAIQHLMVSAVALLATFIF